MSAVLSKIVERRLGDVVRRRLAVESVVVLEVRGDAPMPVDEFQHVPELLDAIKAELNRDSAPGRFVLMGSTRYASCPRRLRRLPAAPIA